MGAIMTDDITAAATAPKTPQPSVDRPLAPPAAVRNRWLLMAAAFVLVAALAFAFSRTPRATSTPASASAAGASDGVSPLEARVAANPDDAAAWAELGQARYDQNDYPGAVAAYTRATRIAPTAGGNWSALGDAMVMAAPSNGPPIPDAAQPQGKVESWINATGSH